MTARLTSCWPCPTCSGQAPGLRRDRRSGAPWPAVPARPAAGTPPVSLRLDGRSLGPLLSSTGLLLRRSARPGRGERHQAPADCARDKCLALTFDDGPAAYTPRLL